MTVINDDDDDDDDDEEEEEEEETNKRLVVPDSEKYPRPSRATDHVSTLDLILTVLGICVLGVVIIVLVVY